MSKHHQSHRRRSYGRRQHELHERQVELNNPQQIDLDGAAGTDREQAGLRFELEPAQRRMSLSVGD
jgi:hypothetical protein